MRRWRPGRQGETRRQFACRARSCTVTPAPGGGEPSRRAGAGENRSGSWPPAAAQAHGGVDSGRDGPAHSTQRRNAAGDRSHDPV